MFHDNRINAFLDMTGYQPKTTFWDDFFIAEHFGEKQYEILIAVLSKNGKPTKFI